MNAICALFHFCEIHGPRTVFCTQAFHAHAKTSPPGTPSDHSPPSSPTSSRPNSGSSTHNLRHPQTGTSPKDAPDSDARAYCVKPPISPSPSLLLGTSSCPACAAQIPFITITNPDGSEWTQEAKGFYTEDDEDENVHYFGSRSPRDSRLYAAVKHACMRSLSIEFYPNREGPVLFGDDKNGYVFSYMFKVRDSQARGETRYYSFIMLMTDCAYLASCWPFLVGAFRSMAMNLQEKAEMIYQREKEAKERQQALVMTGRRTSFGPSPGSVGLTGHVSTDQFLRNRRAATSLRSFVDLLNIKDLYVHMHGQFSWILKAASRRRMEKVVQGRRGRRRAIHEQDENISQKSTDPDDKEFIGKSQQTSLAPSPSSSTFASVSSQAPATPGAELTEASATIAMAAPDDISMRGRVTPAPPVVVKSNVTATSATSVAMERNATEAIRVDVGQK
ncbi:vesicle coat protein [Jimgerdemannia flammicorona]|uniref:Vesicle coat protein n=1 Tax=Jimgerdemannia flammicorona TaxID=994334 RepID=A0A433PDT5_9FUNG|nr:vesicle coat protein [Jimgerdemannia flammicorona]